MHSPALEAAFISSVRAAAPRLAALQAEIEPERLEGYYRCYHQSWKVYYLQHHTEQIVKTLQDLLPGRPFNVWFSRIISEGTGKQWDWSHNDDWLRHTLPILQAFEHAWYFLDVAVQVGRAFDKPCEGPLPYEYAGLLYLFDLR
jgi:hypothetical protein